MSNESKGQQEQLHKMSEENRIAPWNKGLGMMRSSLTVSEIVAQGWNLLREDLSLPAAVLYEDKLQHNLLWMQRFIDAYGLRLAPHGKTTMAPKLFARQLHAGAWGITLATVQQARAAYNQGVRRVLLANQLIGAQNMQIISDLLQHPEFEFYCLVDSVPQVEKLAHFFQARQQQVNVLIELGVTGGRAGVRDERQLQSVLTCLEGWRNSIAICGVEIYEGVLNEEMEIRKFLQRALDALRLLVQTNSLAHTPAILSGAGSAWYDVVAEVFSMADVGCPVEAILRPGCYLTHDTGIYRKAQKKILSRNPVAQKMQSGLMPALQLWAYVQSIPEPNQAILGLGKRDVAFDAGLPMPVLHFRPGQEHPQPCSANWKLTRMMDQHAYMEITAGDDVQVGDMIGLDISHPCLTFDKWRYMPILDVNYQVIDVIETFF